MDHAYPGLESGIKPIFNNVRWANAKRADERIEYFIDRNKESVDSKLLVDEPDV